MNAGPPQEGFTTSVSPSAMATPLVVRSLDCGGPLRSITVGNLTSQTTAYVYAGAGVSGSPLFTVLPGSYSTLPIMTSSAVCIAFVPAAGYAYDGSVFVHGDTQALAASGYTQPATIGAANTFPAAALMQTASVHLPDTPAGGGSTVILGITGQSIYIYSYSLTAVNLVQVSYARLSLYGIDGDLISWSIISGNTALLTAISCSGGPLPLLVLGPGKSMSYNIETMASSTPPAIVGELFLTYAQF